MTFSVFNVKVKVSYLFVSALTLTLFLKENATLFFCILFSLFHECGHIILMHLLGANLNEISFEVFGISIKSQNISVLSTLKRIAVFSGGVMVNLILASLNCYPKINLALALFNILPIGWLDGGRIVFEASTFLFGERAGDIIHSVISFLTLSVFSFLAFSVIKTNFSAIVVLVYLLLSVLFKKRMLKCY